MCFRTQQAAAGSGGAGGAGGACGGGRAAGVDSYCEAAPGWRVPAFRLQKAEPPLAAPDTGRSRLPAGEAKREPRNCRPELTARSGTVSREGRGFQRRKGGRGNGRLGLRCAAAPQGPLYGSEDRVIAQRERKCRQPASSWKSFPAAPA